MPLTGLSFNPTFLDAAADRDVFITVNNKAEGSAPLSVVGLAEAIHSLSWTRSAD